MRGKLTQRVFRSMQNQGVPHAGDRVGVAVSGGADSVALLFLMRELREQLGIVLSVVHLNHKLRARASDADEKFVAKLAAKCGLPFHVEQSDVASLAKRKKANLEDTARRARYGFFERLINEKHVDWVAVAHTADDQAETVLAHILRGAGLAGLGGIHPIAGHVIRPLLTVRRAELKEYLGTKKQTWREDLTNRDTSKMRARIRRKLLPLLEKQFQTVIIDHLGTLAELAREDDAFLDALAKGYNKTMVRQAGGKSTVGIADLIQPKSLSAAGAEVTETRALRKRLVRLMVEEVKPRAGQLNAQHVRAILNLAEHGVSGKQLQLPGGIAVRREHDSLVFCACSGNERTNKQGESSIDFEHAIDLGNEETVIRVPQLGCVFRLRVIDWPGKTGDTRRTGSALDRDALRSPLVLRNWRPGDKLHPIGHRNAHKLKRLLNKKRVGRWERHGWPVLTSGGVLAWARGFPIAAEFAANAKTRAGIVIVEEPIP